MERATAQRSALNVRVAEGNIAVRWHKAEFMSGDLIEMVLSVLLLMLLKG